MDHKETPSYYVPSQSKLPIFASFGMFLTVFGLANWLNQSDGGFTLFIVGLLIFCFVIFSWFSIVIDENMRGFNSAQLKRSYVWGMGWFIFSEVMFFAAFFGALFYIRQYSVPVLGGESPFPVFHWILDVFGIDLNPSTETNELLWNGFKGEWPVMQTPEMAVAGEGATKFIGPHENMSNPGLGAWLGWLPFWNTLILLSSSVTVHIAHVGLKNDKKKQFNLWLAVTVLLGCAFIFLQITEYSEAYQHMGLTLNSGIYGTTFFLLTGFHGLHVTLGTFMLLVQWLRSALKGHFNHDDCFGFEASSWYWHFVDVVWLGLFLFVYILA